MNLKRTSEAVQLALSSDLTRKAVKGAAGLGIGFPPSIIDQPA